MTDTVVETFEEIVADVTPAKPTCEAHNGMVVEGDVCARPALYRAWHPNHGDSTPCAHLICASHAWQYADMIEHLRTCLALHGPLLCIKCHHITHYADWTIAHL